MGSLIRILERPAAAQLDDDDDRQSDDNNRPSIQYRVNQHDRKGMNKVPSVSDDG